LYDIEKKETLPDFIGKIVYVNFSYYKNKPFVTLSVEHKVEERDFTETTRLNFEVFNAELVQQFINKKFKLYDFIGLSYKEITAVNSQTKESFIKRRVYDTFVVHHRLNLSNLAWKKYARKGIKSDKTN